MVIPQILRLWATSCRWSLAAHAPHSKNLWRYAAAIDLIAGLAAFDAETGESGEALSTVAPPPCPGRPKLGLPARITRLVRRNEGKR